MMKVWQWVVIAPTTKNCFVKGSFIRGAEYDDESNCLADLKEKCQHLKDMGAVEEGTHSVKKAVETNPTNGYCGRKVAIYIMESVYFGGIHVKDVMYQTKMQVINGLKQMIS
ncbi:hypothetical protein AVEN_220196-1 [Araneus ventricosus]|uniref:Uncharacterized protein n=1 Tax=Araneus ventricosus TaxID=182803 RepID=A0A4Y2GZF3_ARAVE|nr:hypothetical protein AVEN_220196-1 [Araneus ventricosus]